jgi:hypothetical protein
MDTVYCPLLVMSPNQFYAYTCILEINAQEGVRSTGKLAHYRAKLFDFLEIPVKLKSK